MAFASRSRKKAFTSAVVRFDSDSCISSVKTSLFDTTDHNVGDNVRMPWGEDKKEHSVLILMLSNSWSDCLSYERDYERSVINIINKQKESSKVEESKKNLSRKSNPSPKAKTRHSPKNPKKETKEVVLAKTVGRFSSGGIELPTVTQDDINLPPKDLIHPDFRKESTTDAPNEQKKIQTFSSGFSHREMLDSTAPISFAGAIATSLGLVEPLEKRVETMDTVLLYVQNMEKTLNERLVKLEGKQFAIPQPPFVGNIDELWAHIFEVERRLKGRMKELEGKCLNLSNPRDLSNSLPGGSPQVKRYVSNSRPAFLSNHNSPCPAKRAICVEGGDVAKRLRQDKASVVAAQYMEPMDIELTSEQWNICNGELSNAVSLKNFAARTIMVLFDHGSLINRNMNGKSGKGEIPNHIKKTILKACWKFYPEEMRKNPQGKWKECVTSIDSRLRNKGDKYKSAKLQITE